MFHWLWRPQKPICRRRNCSSISYRRTVITTSGFVDSWSISSSSWYVFCTRITSGEPCEQNWVITLVKFEEHTTHTVIQQYFRFHGRHLGFRQNGPADFFGSGTVEKLTPENMGVDTKIMFLSGRIAEIEGVARLPPPALYVTKFGPLSAG